MLKGTYKFLISNSNWLPWCSVDPTKIYGSDGLNVIEPSWPPSQNSGLSTLKSLNSECMNKKLRERIYYSICYYGFNQTESILAHQIKENRKACPLIITIFITTKPCYYIIRTYNKIYEKKFLYQCMITAEQKGDTLLQKPNKVSLSMHDYHRTERRYLVTKTSSMNHCVLGAILV